MSKHIKKNTNKCQVLTHQGKSILAVDQSEFHGSNLEETIKSNMFKKPAILTSMELGKGVDYFSFEISKTVAE